ncbi:PREDICTED: sacsin-like, partial [Amphimedon queenslandica]|uniref:Sacsin/Nov domain-containing protein n=1 Tax=Amphimedon queenslandica TaxID=400682 RepID=A0AAN0JSI8_AMPQE
MSRELNGEDFGQRRPPLHEMIRTILREYPSGQIFKEIIQNADDARATEVKFYLDCRVLQTLPPSLLSVVSSEANQEVLSQQFTGPALLSYNNAPFRKEDWESIQSLQQSGKAKNPHKVGKFGIGFNSVYHITDLPVILSQNYCGFLEPQEFVWKEKSGKRYNLKELIDKCPEVLEPFDEPFVFVLPSNLRAFSSLFSKFGVPHNVTTEQILSVLQCVRDSSELKEDEAWSKVRAVLDWIADNTSTMSKADILVPVESDLSYPQLIPIDDVSYTDNEMLRGIARTSDEKYNLIHPKVSYLSSKLGVSPLSDQLNITEDVFEDAGQHKPLTTRLSNILREYKDGLTIIKEMIQNADDAGATEVNILHDTRTHPSHNLVLEGMAESHGPALIVHNNSTFTKEDFENITKLAGATKANQPLKIGKFGVGFCSVYHITDVPSFVSGEWLYIFDPTLKHLKGVVQNESRPGKKLKFQSTFLAKSQQLAPYQGLFDFDSSSSYNGTIFRLPFRTHSSQISSTIYNNHLIHMIKKDLESNGSKLLLFLQNVKRITFSSRREGKPIIEELSIECSNFDTENVKVCVTQSNATSTEHWLLSNQEQRLKSQDGAYKQAVASVACKLVKKQFSFLCEAIEGNAFCFLPLSVPATGLPVHVTANFAVMSNRSGIWTGASSAMASDEREYWNQQLMTIVIPEAYCKLLKSLQAMHCSGRLLSYEFHMLWPLASNLQMRFPWESLVSSLYPLISQEELFFSSSICQWLQIAQSFFLPSTLFKVTCSSSTDIIEAVKILKLPVVFLPLSHSSQLQKFVIVDILTEDKFAQLFLQNIDSFSNNTKTRNEILSMMLSAIGSAITSKEHKLLKSLLQKYPCIPTSPKGFQLKRASELVDSYEFRDMFDPEDAMFPEDTLYQSAAVKEGISRLGLMSPYNVCWDVIIKSAKTVESLFVKDKIKALMRVKEIIGCIQEKAEHARREHVQIDPAPPELCQTHFLPVLHKPDKYVLPWKGDGHVLLPPCQVISVDSRSLKKAGILIGSQKAIVNTKTTDSGGCDSIPHQALKLMNIPSQASFDEVHNQFVTLINTFNISMCDDHEAIQLIEEICQNVYEHFEASLKESPKISRKLSKHQNQDDNEHKKNLALYYNKPFIWTGRGFVCPCDVSINWKQLVGPCLYKLPGMLSQHKNLVNCLQVKESFSVEKLLGTFSQMYSRFSPTHRLPQEYHETAKNIIQDLNAKDFQELSPMKEEAILLDANYILRPTNQLVFNDAAWLPPDNDSNYVISLLIRKVALALGVQPTSSKFLDKYTSAMQSFSGAPFGQREELTQRIKNILRDYPLDVTFLKELLQNADDAKASKMYVILDKREHRKERLPSENWAELQGPALLVWNDKEFTEKDLNEIQKLGLGSKRDDEESIAQSIEDLIPTLEKLQIDTHGINDMILPIESNAVTLGGEIPNELIDLLENDINHIFHPEEWVGYENEYGSFIYVIVLYAVAQESFNPLERRYVIAIDSEGNTKEVSTLDLYKLMKVSEHSLEENESQELVLLESDSASAQ